VTALPHSDARAAAAKTAAGGETAPADAACVDLGAGFRGPALRPGDPEYDAARRIWNGAIDKHPGLIARCTGVADVLTAVRAAREHRLLTAVRGGGHNVAGTATCDGGLVIDLSPMKGVRVDPVRRRAWAEAGLLWGEFDRETQVFGLAAPGGIVTHTGVAGLTLGGGIGWLMRTHGLTCDNLLSVDLVTADGRLLMVSEEEHPDLFWGIRGGGGNFGIATSFEFQLHPVGPAVLAGVVLHPAEQAREVLRFYRDFADTAPDELTTIVTLRYAPRLPFIPERLHGAPVVSIGVCYAGPVAEGERVLAALRAFGPPAVDLIRPTQYTAHQGMFDATVPHGLYYYWKSHDLPYLSDRAIDVMIDQAWSACSRLSYAILFQLGGAVSRLGDDATAYGGRRARYTLNINGVAAAAAAFAAEGQWTRRFWEAIRPFSTGGVYMNFLGNEGEERVKAAYGPEKYSRLVRLKKTYDPDNFFRLNQNIKPAG
jgi:FAD/FMN-containing dehydrogenase